MATTTVDATTEWMERVEALRNDPELGPGPASIVQTHISAVLLGGDYVLKLKKPVDFGFLDYSTLERRRAACEAEVRLNRRLSPDLYLGVVPVVEGDCKTTIGGEGGIVDYGVLMRRLPDELMLDRVVARGEVTKGEIAEIAARLWSFHQSVRRGPEVAKYGEPEAIRANWDENFRQTAPFVGRTIGREAFERIRAWVERWMGDHRDLLERRAREGWVREGHGDLRCESICLTRPVTIYDCVEFNERFRCCDVADELGFLAMDLAARGRSDLAYLLCDRYAARGDDPDLFRLLPFYQCYGAFVRGKVLGFELDEAEVPAEERAGAAARARVYFERALGYATPLARPILVAVAGLSGTGKTSVARAIGHELGMRVVSSDWVRDELLGTGGQRGLEYGKGPYSPEANRLTYGAMLALAGEILKRDGFAIVDATFRRAADRRAAADVARAAGASFYLVECRVDAATARARLTARAARGEGLSGATAATHERQAAELEPIGEGEGEHLALDTSARLAEVTRGACAWLRSLDA